MLQKGPYPVLFLSILLFLFVGCGKKQIPKEELKADYSGELSEVEVQNGILTPEILWKFGRISDHQVSPDGRSVLFNVTRYDINTNKKISDIYSVPVNGGESTKLTRSDGTLL